jgi:hypothetical protein
MTPMMNDDNKGYKNHRGFWSRRKGRGKMREKEIQKRLKMKVERNTEVREILELYMRVTQTFLPSRNAKSKFY